MSFNDEYRRKDLNGKIDAIYLAVWASQENGLFDLQSIKIQGIKSQVIFQKLESARANLRIKSQNFSQAQRYYDEAERDYYAAVNSKGWRLWFWRFCNLYAYDIWAILIFYLVSVFVVYFYFIHCAPGSTTCNISTVFPNPILVPRNGVFAVVWGAIGGILQGLYKLSKHISNRDYRKGWIINFISTPFIGGLLGAIVYFLLSAGLLALSEGEANINSDKSTLAVIAVAGYAGFSWETAVNWFKKVGVQVQ